MEIVRSLGSRRRAVHMERRRRLDRQVVSGAVCGIQPLAVLSADFAGGVRRFGSVLVFGEFRGHIHRQASETETAQKNRKKTEKTASKRTKSQKKTVTTKIKRMEKPKSDEKEEIEFTHDNAFYSPMVFAPIGETLFFQALPDRVVERGGIQRRDAVHRLGGALRMVALC